MAAHFAAGTTRLAADLPEQAQSRGIVDGYLPPMNDQMIPAVPEI
jgi:hypothetical protein